LKAELSTGPELNDEPADGPRDTVVETLPDGAAGVPIRSQSALAAEAAARLEGARQDALAAGASHTVLLAHLFAAGGINSESERVFLGTAEQVNAALFAPFDYVALGHLHRFQRIGSHCWYPGSPLAYSFDEAASAGKVFLSVELGPDNKVSVDPIPVRPLRKLSRLTGPFNAFFKTAFGDTVFSGSSDSVDDGTVTAANSTDSTITAAEGDYLEIVLTDKQLIENPLNLLRKRFPWILSVKQDRAFSVMAAGNGILNQEELERREEGRRSPLEDFSDFLAEIYGQAGPEKIELFREILGELEDGEST
jgi:exonuclease SbcD